MMRVELAEANWVSFGPREGDTNGRDFECRV